MKVAEPNHRTDANVTHSEYEILNFVANKYVLKLQVSVKGRVLNRNARFSLNRYYLWLLRIDSTIRHQAKVEAKHSSFKTVCVETTADADFDIYAELFLKRSEKPFNAKRIYYIGDL